MSVLGGPRLLLRKWHHSSLQVRPEDREEEEAGREAQAWLGCAAISWVHSSAPVIFREDSGKQGVTGSFKNQIS